MIKKSTLIFLCFSLFLSIPGCEFLQKSLPTSSEILPLLNDEPVAVVVDEVEATLAVLELSTDPTVPIFKEHRWYDCENLITIRYVRSEFKLLALETAGIGGTISEIKIESWAFWEHFATDYFPGGEFLANRCFIREIELEYPYIYNTSQPYMPTQIKIYITGSDELGNAINELHYFGVDWPRP